MSITTETISLEQANDAAMHASVAELAGTLQDVLSRRVTAYLARISDGKTIARWASGEVSSIRDVETERRLRTAYTIVMLLQGSASPRMMRAWFINHNPRLDDALPMDTIREGRLQEALYAAQAFVANP
jgi:hypothetical protein